MLRVLLLLLMVAAPAMGANELRALVASSSTGVYAVIRNPDNAGQAWDTNAVDWATYNRTDSDQQITMGSAVAAGAGDEWQYGTLPAGLTATSSYGFDVYDSSDELLATGSTEQYLAHASPVPSVTGAVGSVTGNVGGNVLGSIESFGITAQTFIENTVDAEVDQNTGFILDRLGTPAGASVSADIAAAKADSAAILVDTADMQPKLGTFATGTAAGDLAAINTATVTTIPGLIPDATDLQAGTEAGLAAYDAATGAEVAAALTGGGNVLQVDVKRAFTFQMSTRSDGTVVAKNDIRLSNMAERPRIAFDVSSITNSKPAAVTVVEVLDSAGDPAAGLTVADEDSTANTGVRDWMLFTKVTGASTAGTYTVRVTFTTNDSATLIVSGDVIVP